MISATMKKQLQPEDYLKKILTARVYDVAVETPLEPARALSRRLHNKVLLTRGNRYDDITLVPDSRGVPRVATARLK